MKRQRKHRGVGFSISLLVTVLFLLIFAGYSFAGEAAVGKVIGIVGTVEFQAGATQAKSGEVQNAALVPWETAKFQQPVYAKDQFRTTAGSRLKILLADESLIALGPSSKMSVESYIYKPEEKLRQGAINVAHGLSMYIVNKSQNNPNSSFKLISPTANISARGTSGYVSASAENTLVANQSGAVETQNSDPKVHGKENVGSMMKNMIPKGQPPTPPVPLTPAELSQIRNLVVANVAPPSATAKSGKALITVTPEEKKPEKQEQGDKGGKTGGAPTPLAPSPANALASAGGPPSSGGSTLGTGGTPPTGAAPSGAPTPGFGGQPPAGGFTPGGPTSPGGPGLGSGSFGTAEAGGTPPTGVAPSGAPTPGFGGQPPAGGFTPGGPTPPGGPGLGSGSFGTAEAGGTPPPAPPAGGFAPPGGQPPGFGGQPPGFGGQPPGFGGQPPAGGFTPPGGSTPGSGSAVPAGGFIPPSGNMPNFTEVFAATGSVIAGGGPHDFIPVNLPAVGSRITTPGCQR